MIDTVTRPALAMPRKALLAALLAVTMVAVTLVVTPVSLPLVGGVSEAAAHIKRKCFKETYENRTQTTCVYVGHSHYRLDVPLFGVPLPISLK